MRKGLKNMYKYKYKYLSKYGPMELGGVRGERMNGGYQVEQDMISAEPKLIIMNNTLKPGSAAFSIDYVVSYIDDKGEPAGEGGRLHTNESKTITVPHVDSRVRLKINSVGRWFGNSEIYNDIINSFPSCYQVTGSLYYPKFSEC
jgi:hypothetical protein